MFSLKCLTKKFNKQTLNEVKPAPLSETVDHTLSSPPPPLTNLNMPTSTTISNVSSISSNATPPSNSNNTSNTTELSPPSPATTSTTSSVHSGESAHPLAKLHPSPPSSAATSHSSHNASLPLFSSPLTAASTSSLCPMSSVSSDSDESEDEERGFAMSASLRLKAAAHAHSPRKIRLAGTRVRIERISSAEKRKYSQFKCSTGNNSSPSSSDDEVKEAFEAPSTSYSRLPWSRTPPTYSSTRAWGQSMSLAPVPSTEQQQQQQLFNSSWSVGQVEAGRPLKCVPVEHNKHKFFAQMSSSFSSERPYLDFNKMQHSKRVVMVRRPIVIRNHSKVHSIQRPPSLCPHVSLDISQNSFQPVLTQT